MVLVTSQSVGSFPRRLWLVGCGGMGGALLARWLEIGMSPAAVTVLDPEPRALPECFDGCLVANAAAASLVAPDPDLVVLAVKPQMVTAVAADLAGCLPAPTLILSILAGVRTTALVQALAGHRIARAMPNTPARIGQGMTALFGAGLTVSDSACVEALMAAAGATLWLEDEGRFDTVTALSGSGPAYVFRFIEALAGAGEAAGLDPAAAAALALQTVTGAAALAASGELTPAVLRQQVTSPNGTTQAGLDVLDGDGALSSLMRATVRAAAERSRALAAAADAAVDAAPQRESARAS